jgi:hypothetical protein
MPIIAASSGSNNLAIQVHPYHYLQNRSLQTIIRIHSTLVHKATTVVMAISVMFTNIPPTVMMSQLKIQST